MYVHVCVYIVQMRCSLTQCREVMRRQSLQFRAVQKRLLTRFKDKTPSGLSHLDTLLEGTYRQVCTCTVDSNSLQKFSTEMFDRGKFTHKWALPS